jgi:hypothetical protein
MQAPHSCLIKSLQSGPEQSYVISRTYKSVISAAWQLQASHVCSLHVTTFTVCSPAVHATSHFSSLSQYITIQPAFTATISDHSCLPEISSPLLDHVNLRNDLSRAQSINPNSLLSTRGNGSASSFAQCSATSNQIAKVSTT